LVIGVWNLFGAWNLEFGILKKVVMRYALCTIPMVFILVLLPGLGRAQGILQGLSGYSETEYDSFSTTSKDATGTTTKTSINSLRERVSLDLNTTIFPNLGLRAGGMFEKDISWNKTDGMNTKSTTTQLRPYFDLVFSNPIYTAGVGYNRREETDKATGSPSLTTVNEDYHAILGWRPVGFPSMDFLFRRTNTFDKTGVTENVTTDFFNLSSTYTYKGLYLQYQGTYIDTTDKLNHFETTDMIHTGRITYTDSFFHNRVSFNGSYNVIFDETTNTSTGAAVGGTISSQIFPFAGLFLITNMPTMGALSPNSALIDGNLTVSSGINIGVPPLGGNADPRNIGLDLLNSTQVNELFVWVDRDLSSAPAIANSFSWDVYTSSDNLTWTFQFTVSLPPPPPPPAFPTGVTFGPFQNRFDITFPNVVTTRYIKVVVKPLTAAAAALVPSFANPDRIFVTELQAFLKKPTSQVVKGPGAKTTRITHLLNTDVRATILNIPTLYYESSFFFDREDPSGVQTYTLSNGLSANHRFSEIFSGNARVAIENGEQQNKTRTAYIYYASIVATPLRTLSDTLVYSGRQETVGGKSNDNNSIFLNNTAALYKGIDVNLNGGVSFAKNEMGQSQTSTIINFGSTITPHRTLTLNLSYSDTITNQSGGGLPSSSTFSRRGQVDLNYTPFETLQLFASVGVLLEKDQKTQTIQNYGINWSPFPDGTLQFSFAFNESLNSFDNSKSRVIVPSLRWNITSRILLTVSYLNIRTSSKSLSTDSNGFSANLKIFL
jgi:hypothetical protein